MPYILIAGPITDKCLNVILTINKDRYDLEKYAQRYVEDNPGTEVHIFEWCNGFKSMPSVATERLWNSGYVPSEQALPHDASI